MNVSTAENVIVGNLVVRADPTFGGGEVNISGIVLNIRYVFFVFFIIMLLSSVLWLACVVQVLVCLKRAPEWATKCP